jgi:hypothetical protein
MGREFLECRARQIGLHIGIAHMTQHDLAGGDRIERGFLAHPHRIGQRLTAGLGGDGDHMVALAHIEADRLIGLLAQLLEQGLDYLLKLRRRAAARQLCDLRTKPVTQRCSILLQIPARGQVAEQLEQAAARNAEIGHQRRERRPPRRSGYGFEDIQHAVG